MPIWPKSTAVTEKRVGIARAFRSGVARRIGNRWLLLVNVCALWTVSGSAMAFPGSAPPPPAEASLQAEPATPSASPAPVEPVPAPPAPSTTTATTTTTTTATAPVAAPPAPVVTPQWPVPACDCEADAHKRALALHRSERRRGRAMVAAGWSLFASTYLSSALVGTASIDLAGDDQRQRAYGQRMLLPVAGPFMAAFVSRSATGALMTAFLGAAQATGFALATVGHVRLYRVRREMRLSASVAGPTVGLRMQF